ncbi:MAG TPA: Crp/Fnr family transcriptional regulator [Chitinophaga sp.]|uniref:Crp/Fnr family transcriptional regulator n=1 Tax=Chitinophaga sp. TaxID=1869181 RepID=UPI002C4EA921|nr:Crp/Fnr family transcriptional regulator [Chitinophaga sp.]HVI47961.1 Crp/Fnr family transcriptional regulator [Chitinophaga sp.]
MHENLLQHISKFVSLTENDQQLLIAKMQFLKVRKKGYLLKPQHICDGRYFVVSGCLRQYVLKDNGGEQIIQFAIPGWWMSDHHSFESKKPSFYYIQATEDTEIAMMDLAAQEILFREIPALETYFRLVLQRAYDASLTRMYYMFCKSGEERYHNFARSFPEFVQQVPQYMLASFLGLTPEFISTVRSKKNK